MSDPLDALKARVTAATLGATVEERGTVAAIADGLANVTGLPGAQLNEIVTFSTGARGFVMTLAKDGLHVALLDPMAGVTAGSAVTRSGRIASVPVGEALLGRVLDPLGRPLDGAPAPAAARTLPAERPAPAIIERDFVSETVETGILVVDALFAIGRGQRELIIGERQTGKTSIAVDTIVNQAAKAGGGLICVYVAIGQRMSAVRRVIEAVRTRGDPSRSIFVVAEATAEPGLQWLAPFSATSIAEWFRDRGDHVLIVYDDLTKHAATHRELALLSRQPPGREAYPGDIFYLHARLLERSAKMSKAQGGGSLTALPIAEIEAGNLSAYIPTNLISISDGQIVTSQSLFAANQRPAVDVGLSVSRVGGKAQWGAMKAVAGRLRLAYMQYLEMKMFSRFGGFGDAAMKTRMKRGERIEALLSQPRLAPLPLIVQIALLAGLAEGLFDDVDPTRLAALQAGLTARIAGEPRLAALAADLSALDDAQRAALLDVVRAALGPAGPG
ncbi:F0F1 ATP synthase subunit alpha [Xylophilus sp.]|uniref:F0F1 ATP synthase subunit alpha n=1 Tax=Xylophilus sp. TaxID=2653893 RepID=UPI0013B8EE91|nr:F0F1 ATP synthase subunit alpha [Xylophilus sp.]KAF1045290.1 MAG: ATP synthase subunit alpha [Xylophilus sp.]